MTKTELVASVAVEPPGRQEALAGLAIEATEAADVVELRVDSLERVDLPALPELRKRLGKPVIFTCRSLRQGGAFAGSEKERLELLRSAAELELDYVDVEIEALNSAFPAQRLILSHHDFERFPEHPERLLERALELGADVVKLAVRVSSLAETLRLARLGDLVRAEGKEFVPIPLGPSGTSGRILASRLGARFSYAPVSGGKATGPGQVALDELASLYRFSAIGPGTAIYGILGSRASTSLSPFLHNRLFERLEKDAVYVPFEETELPAFVEAARTLGVSGLSVTIPFKEALLPFLDEIDEAARSIGAVNTVVVRDGRWVGFNTDRDGVREPLARFGSLGGRRAIVLGAGGAARAAVSALAGEARSVLVLARDELRAKSLADAFASESGPLSRFAVEDWDVLVNATPLGSTGCPAGTWNLDRGLPGAVVFDMVTSPERTDLIVTARERGLATVSGLEMLAAQATHQALLWTGEKPSTRELLGYARGAGSGEMERYSRQVLFKEIGSEGQARIRASSVLVVGAGALGSIAAEMLVRAGVARLRLVDRDYVDESNLQRQTLYDESDVREGLPKAVAASAKLRRINRDVDVEGRVEDVHPGNALALVSGMDLILDGTDNFETRYLLNDVSLRSGIPWIYAACVGSYGMSFVVLPGESPCLRCLLEEEPPPGTSPTCDTAGVIAPAVHAVSAFQVAEALKILSGRRDALSGAVLSLDVWRASADAFRPARRREDCPACGAGVLDYLSGSSGSQAVSLCGRNAVQVRPGRVSELSLEEVARRLAPLGEVKRNDHLLRATLDGCELVLFRDGRAIIHGTTDPTEARTLYARYVGS